MQDQFSLHFLLCHCARVKLVFFHSSSEPCSLQSRAFVHAVSPVQRAILPVLLLERSPAEVQGGAQTSLAQRSPLGPPWPQQHPKGTPYLISLLSSQHLALSEVTLLFCLSTVFLSSPECQLLEGRDNIAFASGCIPRTKTSSDKEHVLNKCANELTTTEIFRESKFQETCAFHNLLKVKK